MHKINDIFHVLYASPCQPEKRVKWKLKPTMKVKQLIKTTLRSQLVVCEELGV